MKGYTHGCVREGIHTIFPGPLYSSVEELEKSNISGIMANIYYVETNNHEISTLQLIKKNSLD